MDNILAEVFGLVPGETLVTVKGHGHGTWDTVQGKYMGDEMGYVVIASTDEDNPWQCAIPEQSMWWIACQKGEPPDAS